MTESKPLAVGLTTPCPWWGQISLKDKLVETAKSFIDAYCSTTNIGNLDIFYVRPKASTRTTSYHHDLAGLFARSKAIVSKFVSLLLR
jgi:hypothetical protein